MAGFVRKREKGNVIVHRFDDTDEYKRMISNHIVDRLIRFSILDRPFIEERLLRHFGKIINVLKDLLSGRY